MQKNLKLDPCLLQRLKIRWIQHWSNPKKCSNIPMETNPKPTNLHTQDVLFGGNTSCLTNWSSVSFTSSRLDGTLGKPGMFLPGKYFESILVSIWWTTITLHITSVFLAHTCTSTAKLNRYWIKKGTWCWCFFLDLYAWDFVQSRSIIYFISNGNFV